MSKNRPRTTIKKRKGRSLDRADPGYWKHRIYHGTYTYKGETRSTTKWYVKFQIAGKRRTIALSSKDAETAALEACEAYRIAAAEKGNSPPHTPNGSRANDAARISLEYWKPRLLRRKYIELLRPKQQTEWSTVIDHDHVRRLFPLGTMDVDEAAFRAAERFRTIARNGWRLADLQFEQEFTVSVFWKQDPFVCTYTTMLTIPAQLTSEISAGGPDCAIIVEPDEGTGRALRHWLSRQRDWSLRVIPAGVKNLERLVRQHRPVIVLYNLSLAQASLTRTLDRITAAHPSLSIHMYGIFEDSDGIFLSMSGVDGGYMLRRRPPDRLLDPLSGVRSKTLNPGRAQRLIHRYFQRLIEGEKGPSPMETNSFLTIREHEVMVFMAQGLQDKEIASKLNITTWTVNSHVRHIYRKLQVHGRTEAVVKFLELEKAP